MKDRLSSSSSVDISGHINSPFAYLFTETDGLLERSIT